MSAQLMHTGPESCIINRPPPTRAANTAREVLDRGDDHQVRRSALTLSQASALTLRELRGDPMRPIGSLDRRVGRPTSRTAAADGGGYAPRTPSRSASAHASAPTAESTSSRSRSCPSLRSRPARGTPPDPAATDPPAAAQANPCRPAHRSTSRTYAPPAPPPRPHHTLLELVPVPCAHAGSNYTHHEPDPHQLASAPRPVGHRFSRDGPISGGEPAGGPLRRTRCAQIATSPRSQAEPRLAARARPADPRNRDRARRRPALRHRCSAGKHKHDARPLQVAVLLTRRSAHSVGRPPPR
jgi:hypothetical protein